MSKFPLPTPLVAEMLSEVLTSGGIPIVMADLPVAIAPPAPDFLLSTMRQMIEEAGSATGSVLFATTSNQTGMAPHRGNAQKTLQALIVMRERGELAPVAWVALGADVWQRDYDNEEDARGVERGTLQDAHEAGDARVTEALIALCVAPDGPGYEVLQPYTRTDEGIVWAEPDDVPSVQSEGALVTLMRDLVAVTDGGDAR